MAEVPGLVQVPGGEPPLVRVMASVLAGVQVPVAQGRGGRADRVIGQRVVHGGARSRQVARSVPGV